MAIVTGAGGRGRDAGLRLHGRGEVFPGLEAFIWVGILLGLLTAVVATGLQGHFDGRLLTRAGMGAGLGAILGLFAGLGRGVWRPGPPVPVREPEPATPEPAPSPQLWDPWLDDGRDLAPAEPEVIVEEAVSVEEPEAPIVARASVRPRVISPETGEAIRLDDEIGPMIESGQGGIVVILGGPGSGKTTALRHVDAILPPWARGRVRLLEVFDLTEIAAAGPDSLVILAQDTLRVAKHGYENVLLGYGNHEFAALDHLLSSRRPSVYRLARWDQDDAIEYLLATDREACASVMGRLRASRDFSFLDGIPELCSIVLDRMARDESIGDVRTALRGELAARINRDSVHKRRVESFLVEAFRDELPTSPNTAISRLSIILTICSEDPAGVPRAGAFVRLVRHRPAALLMTADRIAAIIEGGRATRVLADRYPRALVREVARQIAGNTVAIQHLSEWIKGSQRTIHPLAASLLHIATPGWRPDPDCRPRLEGATLDGIAWPGQDLAEVNLCGAELRDADLSGANLEKASARKTCLHGANLQDAVLSHLIATDADLGRANLSGTKAGNAQFHGADLSDASLIDANLWRADLTETRIEGADFTGANLEEARLSGLPLRQARFLRARFGGTVLTGCDLEDMELPDADFHDANLRDAVLTGSRMQNANFLGADLRDAKLAEIDWPGACLRDVDLRGANFHLGSTRSGKIDSPIPCEGSRTGFYTDDFLDRDVKPAEEIRKANLRGADLRGADIWGVDFYLVDLRDAHYTADQAAHLRRCRAILDDREA